MTGWKKLTSKFRDLSIRQKLFITYLLLLIVSFTIFISVNSYITSRNTEKQARYSLDSMMQQTGSFLNYKTSSIRKIIDIMVTHDTIQTILTKDTEPYQQNIGNWLLDEYYFNQLIFNVQTNPDIQNISLYMTNGMAAIQSTDQFKLIQDVDPSWMRRVEQNRTPYLWLPPGMADRNSSGETVTFIRKIDDPLNDVPISGMLRAEIPIKALQHVLDQAMYTEKTIAVLSNSHDELVTTSSHDTSIDPQELIQASHHGQLTTGYTTITLGDDKALMAAIPVENTDWKLILAVPYQDIVEIAQKARSQLFWVFLLVALLAFPLAYVVSTSGTLRIRRLSKMMLKVGHDDVKIKLNPMNNDEIGELTRSFNLMLHRIETLAEDKFKLGQDMKTMELRALQAQINPHFLYNTLDMINWLALKYDAKDISKLITALSDFYKISLSNGEDIINIRSELEHIKAYVDIQNMRFRNPIELVMDVPEEVKEQRTLKLILQPLVENAILHGILEKDTQNGRITVSGRILSTHLELYVEDDGIGMNHQTTQTILSKPSSKAYGGYGMKNIHHRLEVMFGYPYGLSVSSTVGVGTKVTARLPLDISMDDEQ
ncbi:cache domain-containing sensor histidine kinase [Paenibacillus tundrae]|uniref:cache domain-containing sensor histidine kinase n=1 Tax=Paenibacillus tundrae TaxID=528187 RepID=UPI0030CB7732